MRDSCDPAGQGFAGWQAAGGTGAYERGDHLGVVRAANARGVRIRRVRAISEPCRSTCGGITPHAIDPRGRRQLVALRGQARGWPHSSGLSSPLRKHSPGRSHPPEPARPRCRHLAVGSARLDGYEDQRGFPP